MQLWIVEHFHLYKKAPVVMNHNIWFFFKCYDSLIQVPFCEDESVQLFRVAFFRRDFFQNPYFSSSCFTPLHFKISTFVYKVRWFQVATYNFMAIQDFYYHFMQQSNWKWCGIFLVSSNFLALFRFSKENVNRCILDIAF